MLQRIEHDRAIFAAMLGAPDRTTLFLLAAEWRGIEHVDEAVAASVCDAAVDGARPPAVRRCFSMSMGLQEVSFIDRPRARRDRMGVLRRNRMQGARSSRIGA